MSRDVMTVKGDDRRGDGRAPRPRPGPRIRLWQITNGIAEWFDRSLYQRVLLGTLLLGALATIGWAMFVQLGGVRQLVSQIETEAALRARVYELEQQAPVDSRGIETAITSAEVRIVTDYGTLAGWLHGIQDAATARGLELTYVVHDEQPFADRPGLIAVPISFTGHRRERATRNPYYAGLEILRQVMESPWLGELIGASGEGQGKGLVELEFEYRIWMRADSAFGTDPIDPASESASESANDPTLASIPPTREL